MRYNSRSYYYLLCMNIKQIIFGFGVVLFVWAAIFLSFEYHALQEQKSRLIALQNDYKNYVSTVKELLDDYNRLKAKEQNEFSLFKGEKKKVEVELNACTAGDQFFVVNRRGSHLKQETRSYLKLFDQEYLFDFISFDDDFDQEPEMNKQNAACQPLVSDLLPVSHEKSYEYRGQERVHLSSFIWPIDADFFWLSSRFGPRKKANGSWGFHHGIDMAALKGTPVYAAASGIVIEASSVRGFGNMVFIGHANNYRTRYAHLDEILVSVGQKVAQGDLIGRVGSTGSVRSSSGRDASHLHFEVYAFGKRVNPMYYLR